jgi:hypothetical protein
MSTSLALGVQIGLKGLVIVMPLSVFSSLVFKPLYVILVHRIGSTFDP